MILGTDLKGFLILTDPSTGSYFAIRKRMLSAYVNGMDLAGDVEKLPIILMQCARILNGQESEGRA